MLSITNVKAKKFHFAGLHAYHCFSSLTVPKPVLFGICPQGFPEGTTVRALISEFKFRGPCQPVLFRLLLI